MFDLNADGPNVMLSHTKAGGPIDILFQLNADGPNVILSRHYSHEPPKVLINGDEN